MNLEKIEQLPFQELTDSDREHLAIIFLDQTLLKALRVVYEEVLGGKAALVQTDIISEEGRASFLKQQGIVFGQERALISLLELTTKV